MAVIENDVLMKFKDSSGNINLLYPITRAEDVVGLQEAIRNQGVVTEGTGAVYTATVEGITSLSAGVSFVMIPHTVSTSSSPKLNVNGLGEKFIRRRVSGSTTTTYSEKTSGDWLAAGKPIRVMYDGTQWIADMPVPYAGDFMGTLLINNGGTGATTAAQARINLGIETADGTVSSENAVYAEVGEWIDSNPDAEDRIGYFVCIDNNTPGTKMRKATADDDVRGVTVAAPAFSGNCSSDKFDSDGNLLAKYSFVAVMGMASVIDNGTCTVNGRCMPNANSTASPVDGDYGYQVIERIDDTHILIAVESGTDVQYKFYQNYLPKSGGTMSGAITVKGLKLTSGEDYGDTLPESSDTGKVFFWKQSGLDEPTSPSDIATKSYVDSHVDSKLYPVGSIYISTVSTSPASLFGGTWEQIKDRFLYSVGDTAFAGQQGGEIFHTLTVNEMPVHYHPLGRTGDHTAYAVTWGNINASVEIPSATAVPHTPGQALAGANSLGVFQNDDHVTANSGGGLGHNNMPPFLTVYMWKRVA